MVEEVCYLSSILLHDASCAGAAEASNSPQKLVWYSYLLLAILLHAASYAAAATATKSAPPRTATITYLCRSRPSPHRCLHNSKYRYTPAEYTTCCTSSSTSTSTPVITGCIEDNNWTDGERRNEKASISPLIVSKLTNHRSQALKLDTVSSDRARPFR